MNTVINEITVKRETKKVFSCYYFGVIDIVIYSFFIRVGDR